MILENKNNNERIIIKAKSRSLSIDENTTDQKELLVAICEAIREGGYDPVSQIVGYLLSEEPTHITNYQNARTLIGKIDRDELLRDMVAHYIEKIEEEHDGKGKKNGGK